MTLKLIHNVYTVLSDPKTEKTLSGNTMCQLMILRGILRGDSCGLLLCFTKTKMEILTLLCAINLPFMEIHTDVDNCLAVMIINEMNCKCQKTLTLLFGSMKTRSALFLWIIVF